MRTRINKRQATSSLSTMRWLHQPLRWSLLSLVIIIMLFMQKFNLHVSAHSINDNAAAIIVPSNSRSQTAAMANAMFAPMNWHEPRIELRYNSRNRSVNLDERSPNNTVVAIVFVSDEDTGPSGETSVAIEAGNELAHFKLVVTPLSNTIQVSGAPLSRQNIPEYNLTLVARDRGLPAKMSSVNLVIKLSPPTPAQSAFGPAPVFRPPFVSELIYAGAMLVVLFSASVFIIMIGCAIVQTPRGKKPASCPPTQATGAPATKWNANLDFYSL